MTVAPYFTPALWQDLNTGSAWIAVSGAPAPEFSQALARVQELNVAPNSSGQWFVAQWDDVAQEWIGVSPAEGIDNCPCGCKYWHEQVCASCGEPFKSAA